MRKHLRTLRIAKGMTMKQTAAELDISESYYSLIESGNRQQVLKVDMLVKLSKVLGCTIDELLCHEAG